MHETSNMKIRAGATILWDGRSGWEGLITKVHPDGFIDVEYENGESDLHINPGMFTDHRGMLLPEVEG
jgi:hypothetical protein